jgi:hypothetical protein
MIEQQIARLYRALDTKSIFITLRSSVAHVSSSGDDNHLIQV